MCIRDSVDGAQSRSIINAAGALVEAAPQLRSSFSLLLYINGGFAGGETCFHTDEAAVLAPRCAPGALHPDDDNGGGAGDGAWSRRQAAGVQPRAPSSDLAPSFGAAARTFTPRRGVGLVFWHGKS